MSKDWASTGATLSSRGGGGVGESASDGRGGSGNNCSAIVKSEEFEGVASLGVHDAAGVGVGGVERDARQRAKSDQSASVGSRYQPNK